jgi:short-chain fatty acids transporter
MLNTITKPFIRFVEKYYPDPFIFAILLTFVAFIMALIFTETTVIAAIMAWGGGLHGLMAFLAQVAFTLISSTALANTRPVKGLLRKLSELPRNAASAYALTCFVAAVASWFTWALGLIAGGIIARNIQFYAQRRGIKVHYPLLVASAYSGFVIWHMGYSGSAQLLVATAGHPLEKLVGIIPVSATTFAPYNVLGFLFLLVTLPLLMVMIKPKDNDESIRELPREVIAEIDAEIKASGAPMPPATTFGEKLERMRLINLVTGVMLVIFLYQHFATRGLVLDLNIVNWTFLALGILLSDSPIHYVRLMYDGSRNVAGILLQFPFYAGLMGMMVGTGLASVFAGWFVALSTVDTLPFFTFFSAGILNMFIPSGGGQWAVQGPIMLEAAKTIGVNPAVIVNAVAYGDQWTNMIQPFWAIPLLAVAGLKMRDMMGYCFITLAYTFIVFSVLMIIA